ncbi:MAG: hypothetical protein J7M38_12500 [Armatimonadetes bacterium]|nr:hypothetical protein [Armatimonadota bacterium]
MMSRSHVLTIAAVLALLVSLGMQGCLFGGGGGDTGGDEGGGAPSGEAMGGGAPPAGGEETPPPGEMMGGGEEAPPAGGEEGAPPAGMMGGAPEGGEMPMGGEGMGEQETAGAAPSGGGTASAALQAKHAGDWGSARAQCEQALAANPDDAEAHRILGWILADDDPKGAIEHFNAYLQSGAQGPQADEVKAAVERLKQR